MSLRKSGLWCDLCNKPILLDSYWHITINGKKGNYHSCEKCKEEREKTNKTEGGE